MQGRSFVARRCVVALAFLVVTFTAGPIHAATWVVEAGCDPQTEDCDCAEIQPCIDAASAGDTVLVRAGTYTLAETRTLDVDGETVDFTANVFMLDGVHLIGDGAGPPVAIIDAQGIGLGIVAQSIGASTIIENLQIQNGNASGTSWNGIGGGMLCLDASPAIRSNIFDSNTANGQGGALACELNASPQIVENIFSGNQANVDGGAVFCFRGSADIMLNEFTDNEATEGAAIRYIASGTISDNLFSDNRGTMFQADIALHDGLETGATVVVERNVFYDNTSAIFLVTNPTTTLRQNTMIRGVAGIDGRNTTDVVQIVNNLIVSETTAGITWQGAILPTLVCNDVWQNGTDYIGIDDPTGTDDNISADPLHCDPVLDDFTLAQNSPCSAANSGCGVLIGALDTNCPPSAVESTTWGAVKATYRQ